ncbi:MAG: Hint domain-containing protein [Rhodobacteraceae bacterium]|nr:Hint domain-containing protein [Paracoccaceae bacterium]
MVDFSRPYDEQSVTGVPINPASNNPIKVDQTSYVQTLGNDAVDDDGFDISANLHGSEVAETVNIAIVIDNSGSTADDSGTDFDGDGSTDSILEGELYAAMRLFDAYISAGYDPSEINISLTTYHATSTQWGTFDLTERDDFIAALEDIGDRGPGGATNFVAGLNSVDTAWSGSGADPSDTNIVVFMSDGEPWPPGVPQDIEGARDALVGDWGADIAGIGIGANSSLGDLNRLDTTPDGADQVLSGEELLDIIVEPLADAEFLRFEIEVEGVDANGDPMTQTLIIDETTVDANGDPVLVTTQLGWSFNCVPLDPAFDPTQDITVTFNGIFAEDPGNPGSGEQVVSTEHLLHLVICFTAGTNILTPNGPVAIEHLAGGDRVVTRDHGVQRIRWIGASEISAGRMQMRADLRPVLIGAGALGAGLPDADMRVSRQHRVLVRDWRSELMFGQEGGVLAAAFTLCNDGDIREERPATSVTYYHMAFDHHEIVYANGVETESFNPAERTVSAMDEAARQELLALFPELEMGGGFAYGSARAQLRRHEGSLMAPPRN